MFKLWIISVLCVTCVFAEDISKTEAKQCYAVLNGTDVFAVNGILNKFEKYQGKNMVKLLQAALRDQRWFVREAAITAFVKQDEKVADKILSKLYSDKDPRVRASVVIGIVTLRQEKALKALNKLYKDKEWAVRSAVATSLSLISFPGDKDKTGKGVLKILDKLLKDKDYRVRLAVVESLSKLVSEECGKKLVTACSDTSEEVVVQAALALKNRPAIDAVKFLSKQVKVGKGTRRVNALVALGYIKKPVDIKLITGCLKDKDWEVRAAACELMGLLAPKEGEELWNEYEELLIKTLEKDKDWGVRSCAATASAYLGSKKAIKAMIASLGETRVYHNKVVQYILRYICNQRTLDKQSEWVAWYKKNKDNLRLNKLKYATKSNAEFYGYSVGTESLAYIIDRSGSMAENNRMMRVKEELWESVIWLEYDTIFNVLSFSNGVELWSEGPIRASWRNRIKLKKHLNNIKPSGGTNINEALLKGLSQWKVDAIFFLTDGEPTVGVTNPHSIIKNVTDFNFDKRIATQIYSLSFEVKNQVFLKPLAEKNKGAYTFIR